MPSACPPRYRPHMSTATATPPPAPIGPRIAAGLLDLAAMSAIALALVAVPLTLTGFTLPMLAVFAVVLGWAVVPLWLFRATPFMRLFSLQLVGLDGRSADLGEIAFRELVGRGLFGAAYLATLLVGIVGMLLGRAQVAAPIGLGFFGFVSLGLVGMAFAGGMLALARPDGRSLADLVGRTRVVVRTVEPLPADPDERADELAARRRRLRNFLAFLVVLLVGAVGAPTLFGTPQSKLFDSRERGLRLDRERLAGEFQRNPESPRIFREYREVLFASDEADLVEEITVRHEAAVERAEVERRARKLDRIHELRTQFDLDPADARRAEQLLRLYEEDDQLDEAQAVYAALAKADPAWQAGYGTWLWENDRNALAVTELERAIAAPEPSAYTRAVYGFALRDVGRAADARTALKAARDAGFETDELFVALAELDEELGPEPAPKAPPKKGGAGQPARRP